VPIVKNVFAIFIVLFSVVVASYSEAVNAHGGIATDGEYIGLEKLPNLTPEDPDTAWFHENRLVIRNDEAILDKVPITITNRNKVYSASDGGFLTYRARFTKKGGQDFITMRLFKSDYVEFTKNRHEVYREIKTYAVRLVDGDRMEIDGVRYQPAKLAKTTLDRLVHLLRAEPLEKADAGR
jgi:hypothetical protein